jgi:lambda repressor-like predicted transcriptional regulator
MHPAQIKAALALRGYSQARLAEELELSPNTVSAVVKGRSRSKKVEERIAAITDRSLVDLWPQWHAKSAEDRAEYRVVSEEEWVLIKKYRELSGPQREQAQAMLQVLKLGVAVGASQTVIKTKGGRHAGRDFIQGGVVRKKK